MGASVGEQITPPRQHGGAASIPDEADLTRLGVQIDAEVPIVEAEGRTGS